MGRPATAAIAVACGAVAACLYLGIVLGSSGALILVYLTQLPLFVAGLWLGAGAAAVAGASGTLVLLGAYDLLGAAIFAALNAGPVTLLVRQVLLARRRPDGSFAWYPPGLLTAWLTGLALAGIAAAVLLLGGPDGLQAGLREMVAQVLDRIASRPVPNRELVAEALATIIPGVVAASWMVTTVANGALAQGLLARFGANWRPSPPMAALALPVWLTVALAGAAALTIFPGAPRFIGLNMTIVLFVAFCLGGLAVLHAAARRLSQPTMALVSFYTVATLFGWPFMIVAVLGLLESWLGLRRRLAPQGAPIDG
jgi:Predicted membrane protein (DUF2232)